MSRLKSGGYCSTAKAPGLKPCSVGSRSHNAIGNCNPVVIKALKTGALTPRCPLHRLYNDKRKKSIKSGRPALPGH